MGRAGTLSSEHVAAVARERPHVLRDYALLADGERGILVGPRGDFGWMCFPRWDSGSLFDGVLGGLATYSVAPVGRYVWGGYYEEGSLIWRSRWITESGAVECREALALPGRSDQALVMRRIQAVRGTADVRVLLDPRGDYGRVPPRSVHLGDDGHWRMRAGDAHLRWIGADTAELRSDGHGGKVLSFDLHLEPGTHHDLLFLVDEGDDRGDAVSADVAWVATEAEWKRRIPSFAQAIATRDARHSYAVLSGLTSSGGGMVAAATMSLPERAEQGRNYDYRYVWIRDQCLAGQAVAKAGDPSLMDDAVRFVADRLLADGPHLTPAYTTSGGRVPDQHPITLPGYPGGGNVVGNHVNEQFQLDVFGESLLLFAAASSHDHLDATGWRAAEVAAEAITQRWSEADAGIWELDAKQWTHSRLICAAGLRAVSARPDAGIRAAQWLALADAITADAARHGLHASGRWQRAYDDSRVDAALLLAGIRGAVPSHDPRTLATLHAVEAELTEDFYCYRFQPDNRPLGEAEGAFLLCGFVMALAWAKAGDRVRAARWFERNRAGCGPPGLFTEEFDVRQRQLRGNFPQAFVHALMLECAVGLSDEHEH
ncbi:MAG: glycoside hydrolase family 15 protein [Candidatus Dormibacteria bacterium]